MEGLVMKILDFWLVSISEAAKFYGVSVPTMRRWAIIVATTSIPTIKSALAMPELVLPTKGKTSLHKQNFSKNIVT